MCKREEETIEHLFNDCPLADQLWQRTGVVFEQTDRDNTSINTTIYNWRRGGYKSEVVNLAWRLSIGFLLRGAWKEQNYRIFRGAEKQPCLIWNIIIENIRETILVER